VLVISALASIVQIAMGERPVSQEFVPHDPEERPDEGGCLAARRGGY
jgi:hypothetical protein